MLAIQGDREKSGHGCFLGQQVSRATQTNIEHSRLAELEDHQTKSGADE
jgi:hypothetical protein